MFIKPEHKTKQPKTMKAYTVESKTIDQNEYIPKIDPSKLSLDYLIENKVITILSRDHVIEHGKNYGLDEVEQVTRGIDYMCYPDMEYPDDLRGFSGLFSGVVYERYGNLSLRYYDFYKDGLLDGVSVNFYLSGKIKGYGVYDKGRLTGELYEWYENGMIKCYNNGKQLIRFEEEGYM